MRFIFKFAIFVFTLCIFCCNLIFPFFIVENDNKDLSVPKIHLIGDISNMSDKKDERKITVNYEGNGISFIKYAEVKLQGSSSLRYEKKNYNIKFYNDSDYSSKYRVNFGWGDEYKYCLKANWIDKTHARNIVSARVIASVQKKYKLFTNAPNFGVIDGFPIEVYNNGEFLGLYTLNIPKDAWLYGMDENNKNHIAMVPEFNNDIAYMRNIVKDFSNWECEVGEENDYTLSKFNRLISFINDSTDKEFKRDFDEYLNLDAVLNYYVLSEMFYLIDNKGKNLVMVTYDGLVWYPTLYDLDSSFGVNPSGNKILDYNTSVNLEVNKLFERVSSIYSYELADRYFELRNTILTEKNINLILDEFMLSIPMSSLVKEQNRWDNIPGYDTMQIRNFVNKRLKYLDNFMFNRYID